MINALSRLCFILLIVKPIYGSSFVTVRTTETGADALSIRREGLEWKNEAFGPTDNTITIDESTIFQDVDGLGVTLSDSSAWLMWNKLNESSRKKMITKLFDPEHGMGLDIVRIYVGASSFSVTNYTYDETCCDLSDFSIEHDQEYIIPILREVLKINLHIKIFAISQTPPAWMKSSESIIGGHLKAKYFKAFAEYLYRFVEEYEKAGIPIYALLIQDEPQYNSGHPSMWMVSKEQAYLLRTKIGPLFDFHSSNTKLLVSSQNWDMLRNYGSEALQDQRTRNLVSGIGFTCYNGSPEDQQSILSIYPEEDLWLVECTDEIWSGGLDIPGLFGRTMRREIIGSFLNGARGIMKFNIALDSSSGPKNGGCPNCLGLYTIKEDGTFSANTAVGAYEHLSKFIRKGAKRIDSFMGHASLQSVAFLNDNDEIVLVVFNHSPTSQSFTVRWDQRSFQYGLESNSAATFVWTKDYRNRSAI